MTSGVLRREGYWKTDHKSLLPRPRGQDKPWRGKRDFLAALAVAQQRADPQFYKGWSTCRLCGKRNGTSDYTLKGWRWPSGFWHYVKVHNVRPSVAFQEFVVGHHLT